jgi:cytochrome c-type biogenesis protein CcmF
MIAELGHYALVLALGFALAQAIVPLIGARRGDTALMRVAEPASMIQFALVAGAFLALMHGYLTSDFSIENVWQNSHSAKPMLYKVTGVWGNHEGSMILWLLILTFFGACVAVFGGNLPASLKARVLSIQALIGVAFLLFVIVTSNPFVRLVPAPADGRGLNPVLQDPALAFHPPFLYAGYVGFSVAFSFAIAALLEGRVDAAWARWVRPWTLAAWMFLTLGIAMGSWWAYYELGWGGWWFWDPVENASFMPWLAGTALLHSAIVVERREALKTWTVLLAILAFSLSLIGTFLVRSGVLTSVHAFAVDPERGIFVLVILCLFIGGALSLFAWRAPTLRSGGLFAPISRETGLILNNLLLTVGCATVLFGTLYPLALEAFSGAKSSVGAPFFNLTFVPLMVPLLMLVPFGPLLAWKRADAWATTQRLAVAAMAAIVCGAVAAWLKSGGPLLAPFGMALGVWLVAGAFSDIAHRVKLFRETPASSLRRAAGLPRSAWGTVLAHGGLGVMVLGIVAVSAWRVEKVVVAEPGETIEIAGFELEFAGVVPRQGPNYQDQVGLFTARRGGVVIGELEAAKRVYTLRQMPTTEAAIHTLWTGDLYVVLGDPVGSGYTVRAYYNPLAPFIWIGAVIMFVGGAVSLSDRRYRIGAPKRARAAAQPAGQAQA